MKKKILGLLLVFCMLVPMGLAACGKKPEVDDGKIAMFLQNTGITTSQLEKGDYAKMLREYAAGDSIITFDQNDANPEDAQQKITNIFTNRLNYAGVTVTKNQFYALMAQDGLADITTYVNASKNLKAQISDLGWGLATKGGKIFAIPQKTPVLTNNVVIAYRRDWLDAYNVANASAKIPVPSKENGFAITTGDYSKLLTYFKTQAGASSGMVVDKGGVLLEPILPAFGVYQDWADVNGKMTYNIFQPGMQSYIDYVGGLKTNNLLAYNADGAAGTGALASLKTGQTGAARMAFWSGNSLQSFDKTLPNMANAKFEYIQALIPDSSKVGNAIKKEDVRVYASEGYEYFTVVPKYTIAAKAERVVKYADKLLDETFFKKAVIGDEGTHFTVDSDGNYIPNLSPDPKNPGKTMFDQRNIADKFLVGTREKDYAKYWWARARKNENNYKATLVAFNNIENTGIKSLVTVMPPIEEYTKHNSQALAQASEQLIFALYPNSSAEKVTLSQVQAKYIEYKGQTVIDAVNNWYKDWSLKDKYNPVKPRA